MSVEIDPQYREEIEKSKEGERIEIDSEGAVFSFLHKLSKSDLSKEYLDEINLQLKNLEKGETTAVIKFLLEKALDIAERNYGIKVSDANNLKDRVAEARVGLDEEISNKQAEFAEMNAHLEEARAEGEPWEVKESELEALRLGKELGELQMRKEDDFSEIQNLIDAAEALEKQA